MSVAPAHGGAPADQKNVALYLATMSARRPDAPALHVAKDGTTVTFAALEASAGRLAAGFLATGLRPNDRVLVMLRPGIHLVATVFALLRVGAVPVFADPGLGRHHLLGCIAAVAPRGLVAIPLLHAVRRLRPAPFRTVTWSVAHGFWPGTLGLSALGDTQNPPPPFADVDPDEAALIAFTTGSTGEPKGVCLSHRVLHAQVRAFRGLTGIEEGDVHLALLPMLAVLGPGLGCATVLPDMDARRPARVDPRRLADAIVRYGVTHGFGSPTPWRRLADHCEATRTALPSFKRLLVGGAPVSVELVRRLRNIVGPAGEVHVPYGATEAVPLTSASDAEMMAAGEGPAGQGTLVGRACPGTEVRVVRIVDGPLPAMGDEILAPRGTVGEIAVRSDVVSSSYFARPDADALAKIADPRDGGGPWHRMGDLGRFDDEGRLWFCGRKSERIESAQGPLYTACVEPTFEKHPKVARAAVVGVGPRGRQRPVLVVEPARGHYPRSARARTIFGRELRALGAGVPAAAAVSDVLFRTALPLDVRHNAKILRHDLAAWAEKRLS